VSRNENIDNAIWDDPEFVALSPYATLLYLWGFTNPRCGMAGLYKVTTRPMLESKVPDDALRDALGELADLNFAFYEDNVLWVRSRVKHLLSRSPKIARSIAIDVLKIPPKHVLRVRFLERYGLEAWLRDPLSEPYGESIETLSEKPLNAEDSHTLSGPFRKGPTSVSVSVGSSLTTTSQGEGTVDARDLTPPDFPDELVPHLDAVVPILRALAERHGAKAVERMPVAHLMTPRSRKPLVRAAYDFASWCDGKAQKRKDVLAGYRNWLDKTDDLATVEVLGHDNGRIAMPERSKHLEFSNRWQASYPTEEVS
jgi:hypothetical protein